METRIYLSTKLLASEQQLIYHPSWWIMSSTLCIRPETSGLINRISLARVSTATLADENFPDSCHAISVSRQRFFRSARVTGIGEEEREVFARWGKKGRKSGRERVRTRNGRGLAECGWYGGGMRDLTEKDIRETASAGRAEGIPRQEDYSRRKLRHRVLSNVIALRAKT